jgi:hypothetical protein
MLIVAAVGWRLAAPGMISAFPSDLDRQLSLDGTAKLLVTPQRVDKAAAPVTLSLHIDDHIRVIDHTGGNLIVQDTQRQALTNPLLGGTPAVRVSESRYVLDARRAQDIPGAGDYALSDTNTVDRGHASAFSFDSHIGTKSYSVYQNETGRPLPVTKEGGTTTVGGLDLVTLSGAQQDAKLTPAYATDLATRLALPTELTLDQLAGLFGEQPPAALIRLALPFLDRADVPTITSLLATPVPLVPSADSTISYLAEPVSGLIVSPSVRQDISLRPDLDSSLGQIEMLLGEPRYADNAAAVGVGRIIGGYVANPPSVPAAQIAYSGTDATVAAQAAYAGTVRDRVQRFEITIPLALGGLGLLCVLIGLPLAARGADRDGESPRRAAGGPGSGSAGRPTAGGRFGGVAGPGGARGGGGGGGGPAGRGVGGRGPAVATRGVSDRGVATRGVSDRGVSDRGLSDRGASDRGVANGGVSDRGVADRRVADGGGAGRGVVSRDALRGADRARERQAALRAAASGRAAAEGQGDRADAGRHRIGVGSARATRRQTRAAARLGPDITGRGWIDPALGPAGRTVGDGLSPAGRPGRPARR